MQRVQPICVSWLPTLASLKFLRVRMTCPFLGRIRILNHVLDRSHYFCLQKESPRFIERVIG